MDIKNTDCTKCPELVKSRKRITWGYGNEKSPVVFVGEAPGRFGCDITGIPFTKDRSGELFQEMLRCIDLTKENIYVTNIVKCCPAENRTPTFDEIGLCSQYLKYELDEIKPRLIVLLGASAIQYFFPDVESVLRAWNTVRTKDNRQYTMLPHPAYICRTEELKGKYLESFKNIRRLVYGEQEYCQTEDESLF